VTLGLLVNAMSKAAGATSTPWRGTTYRGHRVVGGGDAGPGNELQASRAANRRL